MIQGAARSGKDKIMHFRKIAAGAAAIMMALVCGCSVRSSSDAAWPTGKVSDKKALTVSYDAFSKEYKYWLLVNQIPDDTADEVKDKCRSQRESIINYLVNEKIVLEQAKNYGVDQFTDEELDSIESDYNSYIESSIESFRSYVNAGESGTGEVSGDAAILEEAEKIFDEKLTECGMTRDDILMWYRNAKTADKLKAKLAEDDPVEYSDAEEQYSEIVAGIKQVYENSPADYEQDLYYKYYWLPDNARMIKHILIKFDSDDSAEITACRGNNDEAGAEKAREKALENLRPRIEEIKNMLDNGADFDELAKEYSEDTGLSSNPDGYLVVPNGETYYKEFQQAAYELQNVGDYTLVGTDLGWHVVMYAADAVMTEENEKALIDAIYENMQSNAATSAYNNAMQGWRTEYAYDFDYAKLDINESDTAEAASTTASAAESSVIEQTSSAESTAA